ncbi:MAG: iron-sulfur cluster assembly scaffold protein [Candidatus Uhrbacteria bacterium]|nr:iron-sulfur cluster assembly scaffold protein [Patescibacteria group bacterium]MBU1907446.1 iron-sulfur cluster assembly scaffold protein [Patescibacteria group bacterium]
MEENKKVTKQENNHDGDVVDACGTGSWFYSDEVKEHFFNPKNFANDDPDPAVYNAYGEFGSPACGDKMRIWLQIDPTTERIKDFKWKTFGCASAIASTSMASVMITENGGMTLDEALALKPQHILERLGGLPTRKVHCSVLCDQALKVAIDNYRNKA